MTEFQELQIKSNFHLANMMRVIHNQNYGIIQMMRAAIDFDRETDNKIKNILKENADNITKSSDQMLEDLKEYYKDKAGE